MNRYQSGIVCWYHGASAARSQTILASVEDESTNVKVPSVNGLGWVGSVELNVPVSWTEERGPFWETSMAEKEAVGKISTLQRREAGTERVAKDGTYKCRP
jgi:hypothetical protein